MLLCFLILTTQYTSHAEHFLGIKYYELFICLPGYSKYWFVGYICPIVCFNEYHAKLSAICVTFYVPKHSSGGCSIFYNNNFWNKLNHIENVAHYHVRYVDMSFLM